MATAENFSVEIDNLSTPESDNLLPNISDYINKKEEKEKDLESSSR